MPTPEPVWLTKVLEEITTEIYETSGPGTGIHIDEMRAIVNKHYPVAQFLHCHSCGKQVSTGFYPVPTETPDKGLIVRAYIQCPECIERFAAKEHEPNVSR